MQPPIQKTNDTNNLRRTPVPSGGATRPQPPTLGHTKEIDLMINTFDTDTVGQKESRVEHKDGWPGLEDLDERFLPNPPDEMTPETVLIVGGICMKKEVQAVPVRIFPRPSKVVTKALPDNDKRAQKEGFRPLSTTKTKQTPGRGKKPKQLQYHLERQDERSGT